MRVIALGTGGPRPDPDRNASCTVVEVGGEYLVFDTGRGIVRSFARKAIAMADVAALFITHHHYDHIGELADFMISSWLEGRRRRLPVFGPRVPRGSIRCSSSRSTTAISSSGRVSTPTSSRTVT